MTTPRQPIIVVEAEAIRASVAARAAFLADASLAGVGWATVELERAARELDPAGTWIQSPRDALLGATAWRHLEPEPKVEPPVERPDEPADAPGATVAGDQPVLLLLEPDTEGRLAASLVRFGEGVAAIYLRAGSAPGPTPLGAPGDGPLGPGRIVLGGPAWGPHVIVLDERTGS